MVYCQNFSLNSIHPSDKVRPSVRAMPAIKERARLTVVRQWHPFTKNQLQIRSEAQVWESSMISKREKERKETSGEDTHTFMATFELGSPLITMYVSLPLASPTSSIANVISALRTSARH